MWYYWHMPLSLYFLVFGLCSHTIVTEPWVGPAAPTEVLRPINLGDCRLRPPKRVSKVPEMVVCVRTW